MLEYREKFEKYLEIMVFLQIFITQMKNYKNNFHMLKAKIFLFEYLLEKKSNKKNEVIVKNLSSREQENISIGLAII